MDGFPSFMKSRANRIAAASQFTEAIDGYVFDGIEGSQMAFWTCAAARETKEHVHPFDEYAVVVAGRYRLVVGGDVHDLGPGDEIHIPAGTPVSGWCEAGTRTIHAFGGRRAERDPG